MEPNERVIPSSARQRYAQGHTGHQGEWTAAIYRLMADYKWHTFEEIVAKVGRYITPGRAMRRVEVERKRESPKRKTRYRKLPESELVRSGKRRIIYDSIESMRDGGIVEKKDRSYRKYKSVFFCDRCHQKFPIEERRRLTMTQSHKKDVATSRRYAFCEPCCIALIRSFDEGLRIWLGAADG